MKVAIACLLGSWMDSWMDLVCSLSSSFAAANSVLTKTAAQTTQEISAMSEMKNEMTGNERADVDVSVSCL